MSAAELCTTHASASYHLRVLATAGEVVEAGEETIRGSVAKRYRHIWDARSRQPLALAFGIERVIWVAGAALVAIALLTLLSRSVRDLPRVSTVAAAPAAAP